MTADVLQPRLAVSRRLYLYTVAFVSLCTIHVNLRILARNLTYVWIGFSDDWIGPISYHSGATDNVSLYSASLLVALLFFVLHWILIQRFLVRDRTEKQSSLRHFFMWACLVLNFYWFGAGLADFLYVPLQHLTGQLAVPSREELLFLPPLTLQFAVATLCVDRFARICISERYPNRHSKVQSIAAVFQFVVQFIFLVVVVWYLRRLIYILLEPFNYYTVKQISWSFFSGTFATVLSALAILIWLYHMCRTWRNHTRTTLSAAFHLGYLQAGMLLGVILAVMIHRYSAAPLSLRSFLSSRDAYWDNVYLLAGPAVVALGLACWQVHAWLSRRSPERKRAAEWGFALPRFRDYVLALVGLALLGSEVFFILHEDILPVLHRGLGFIVATRHFLNSILDSGGILTSVLLLVATWLTVARHERSRPHSVLEVIPRRIYLYLVSMVSALILMGQGGLILHALWLAWSTGEPVVGREEEIARSVLTAIVLAWHLIMLRRQEAWSTSSPSRDRASTRSDRGAEVPDTVVEQPTPRHTCPANGEHCTMPTSDMDTAGRSWISDRFALILSILIGTLLVAALISVLPSRTRAGTQEVLQYRTDNSPEAVVHNGYVALQRNDMNRYIPLFELERWQLLRRQEDHILYGRQEEGQIGIKVVDATVTGTTAFVTVTTLHTGGTYPKYPRSAFFAMRLFRTERWRVDVEQVDGKWKLALRLPESKS